MKHLSIYALVVLSLIFTGSCTKNEGTDPKDKKECGEESTAGIHTYTEAEWDNYTTVVKAGSAEYEAVYFVNNDNRAVFELNLVFNGLCPYEAADIGMTFSAKVDNPDVSVYVDASEFGVMNSAVVIPVTKSSTLYNCYVPYVFPANADKSPTTLIARARVMFPTKGSEEADREYFFNTLVQTYGLTVHAKQPK